jgi:glutamine cyclotransferase
MCNYLENFFSQGFKFWNSSTIIESTGLYGESVIHYLDAKTFKELKVFVLNHKFFGEGSDWIVNKDGQKEIH